MALHPVKLPRSAALMFRVVALQKRLLRSLADSSLTAGVVNVAWVQAVWPSIDTEWVRKFCLQGQEGRLQVIAQAPTTARQALYSEFCRQNKVGKMLEAGGDFKDLEGLPGVTPELAATVGEFFKLCYGLLSHDTGRNWRGYELGRGRVLSNRNFKEDFCSNPTYLARWICPYCDGELGTPDLDHYFSKSKFPLLACSPWNLVPICKSCNDAATAKGNRLAITAGPPRSTADWLHPFFRPASNQVQIRLTGRPQHAIPRLHSLDTVEQARLDNHTELIPSLGSRWTNVAAAYYDRLVGEVSRSISPVPASTLVMRRLEDHVAVRGRSPSSMIHAAVCRAVLDRRPEYLEEFASSNPPQLS